MGLTHGVTTKWQATKGVVQNGLVLNVDAAVKESYDSGTTWYDLVKNNNGSIVNGPVYDKEKGGKFILDGTNDYISFGQTSVSVQGPATIDVWASWSATNGNRNLASLTSSAKTQIGTRTNGVVWRQGGHTLVTYTTPTVDQLANWIVTVDGSNLNVYIDGSLDNSTTSAGTQTGTNASFWLGTYNGGSELFQGSIYCARLYNRVLTAAEVSKNFNVMRHRFGI